MVSSEYFTVPTAAYALPYSEGVPFAGQGAQAAQNLPRRGGQDLRTAGLGSRIGHHRFLMLLDLEQITPEAARSRFLVD